MPETTKQVFRVTIRASIKEVWDTLTKQGEPLPFFFGSVLHTPGLQLGAPIRMRTPSNKYTGVVGDVLEFDPPHRYAHTFKFTNLDDPLCKVTYELKEVADGVEFTLIAEDVPCGTKTEKQMSQGGQIITTTLKKLIETGKPTLLARMIMTIGSLTEWLTPKKCLSSNWPDEKQIG